jgi:hypothetical protein
MPIVVVNNIQLKFPCHVHCKRRPAPTSAPLYTFDTTLRLPRVVREPAAILLDCGSAAAAGSPRSAELLR